MALLALIVAFAFVGCGEEPGNPGANDGTASRMVKDVKAQAGGITLKPSGTQVTFDDATKVATVKSPGSGNAVFYVEQKLVPGTYKVTYSCAVVSGVGLPKATLKKGANVSPWADLATAQYPDFEEGLNKTFNFTSVAADATVGQDDDAMSGILFQHNTYNNNNAVTYLFKIISIVKQ